MNECPKPSDIPADPNPCLNWTAPLYCVRFGGGGGCFGSIQSAIDAVPLGETILVHGDPSICEPPCVPQPWTYFESPVINRRVCLKAVPGDFWSGTSSADMRYPVVIQSPPASTAAVTVTNGGSGSCIQGFKLDHRGSAGAAVQLGVSAAQGAPGHADNVSVVANLIDTRNAASPANGLNFNGHDNRVHRNVVRGNAGATAGIRLSWEFDDPSLCSDWKDNSINDNSVSSFQVGVLFQSAAPLFCGPAVTFGRIDRNDVRDCELGVQTGASGTATPMRVHIMENTVSQSRLFNDTGCGHQSASMGLHLNDLRDSDVIGNRLIDVDIGIHFGYDACYTRVKGNRVFAGASAPFQRPVAAWVCPSHCNELIGNDLAATGGVSGQGVAVEFTNRDLVCRGVKLHGRHFLDGGSFHDVRCITEASDTATIELRAAPGRAAFNFIECP